MQSNTIVEYTEISKKEQISKLIDSYAETISNIPRDRIEHLKSYYSSDDRSYDEIEHEILTLVEKVKAAEQIVNKDIDPNILDNSIILIGPMGSGKSTIANLLCKKLNMPYVSLDNREQLSSLYEQRQNFESFKEFEFFLTGTVLTNLPEPVIIDFGAGHSIYEDEAMFLEMQSNLLISLYIDKDPYIKELTKDKVINVTGQSGSGKSTYVKENFNNDNYIIIDTDEIFGKQKTDNKYSNNLQGYFADKYKDNMPTLSENFDLIYEEILNYFKEENKTIVIDCAQFHCIKDITKLKGKIIIIRTCIDTCYNRTIERYKKRNPNYTEDELNTFKERKKAIFKWYKGSNEFIEKIDKL